MLLPNDPEKNKHNEDTGLMDIQVSENVNVFLALMVYFSDRSDKQQKFFE